MSTKSILEITDCIDTIDLLNIKDGFLVCDWNPAVAAMKDGGSWQSSPLADGKRLAYKSYDNAVETFELKISGASQDAVIAYIQSLVTMLEKAIQYWTTPWQRQPVWIKARGATESNPRYAVIKAYTIDGLSNPFSQPFFGNCKSAMDKFTLVVERDHWIDQFPGTGVCIELNNEQNYIKDNSTTLTFPATNPWDDAYYSNTRGVKTNPCIVGLLASPEVCDSGIRFPSINIPKNSLILTAYMTVTENISSNTNPVYSVVRGELSPNAALFSSSVADFLAREANHTEASTIYDVPANTWVTPGGTQIIYGLTSIVQEIVNQYAWVSGNALAILIEHTYGSDFGTPTENSYIAFETAGSGMGPVLTITYVPPATESTAGRASTCTGNVYVSNKHNTAQLTHIFIDGAGANVMNSPLPWTLLASPPIAGSEVYFGISNATGCAGPFDSLTFNLSVASVNTPLVWYYANTAAPTWALIEAISDKSTDLSQTGESIIIFVQPADWVKCQINGVDGWWVKAVVGTPPGATTAPVQQDTSLYTVVTPFVDIDGDDIVGELPALARIRLYGKATNRNDPNCIVVGSRTKSRGANFTPYLNFSQIQNPAGVSIGYPGFLVADSSVPAGYKTVLSITAEVDSWTSTKGKIILNSQIANDYIGSFHAYCRYSVPTGADDDFSIRLAYSFHSTGPWSYTDPISIPYTYLNVCVADLGIVTLGNSNLAYGEKVSNIYFEVEYLHNVDTNSVLWLYDLVFIPTDEWTGLYRTPTSSLSGVLSSTTILDIDPIGNPRSTRALLRSRNTGEELLENYESEWIKMTRGGPYLQTKSDQRLWFTAIDIAPDGMMLAFPMQKLMVKVYKAHRYLTMRGAI